MKKYNNKYIKLLVLFSIICLLFLLFKKVCNYTENLDNYRFNTPPARCDSLDMDIHGNLKCPTDVKSMIKEDENRVINFKQPLGNFYSKEGILLRWRKLGTSRNSKAIKDITVDYNYVYTTVLEDRWRTGSVFKRTYHENFTLDRIPKDGGQSKLFAGQLGKSKGGRPTIVSKYNNQFFAISVNGELMLSYNINPPINLGWKVIAPCCISDFTINGDKAYCIGKGGKGVYITNINDTKNYVKLRGEGGLGGINVDDNYIYAIAADKTVMYISKNNPQKDTWKRLANCCVKQIKLYNGFIYGIGNDNHIYKININKSINKKQRNWKKITKNPLNGIRRFTLLNNYIYAATKNEIYTHPLNINLIEGFIGGAGDLIDDLKYD